MPVAAACLALVRVLFAVEFGRAMFGFPSAAGLFSPSLSQRRVTTLLGLACHAPTISVCGAPQLQFISSVFTWRAVIPEPAAAGSERPKGAGPFFTRDLRGPAVR